MFIFPTPSFNKIFITGFRLLIVTDIFDKKRQKTQNLNR